MSSDGQGDRRKQDLQRSGEFSADRRFDPDALFEVIANTESAEQAASAMEMFVQRGDGAALEQAIAIYARSARAQGKKIENILADLNALSHRQHERYSHDGELLKPTDMKKLVLKTVLEAFES